MIKVVILAFCSIQEHFIGDICAILGIPYFPQSPDIGQNSDGGISDFRISGQSLIKENCRNFRTSDDTDMELGSVTELDKKNKRASKKFNDNVMPGNCVIIGIYPIFVQFTEIRKPDSRRIVCKIYVFINSNLLLCKNWIQN